MSLKYDNPGGFFYTSLPGRPPTETSDWSKPRMPYSSW